MRRDKVESRTQKVLKYDRGEKKEERETRNEIRGRGHNPAGTIVKKTPGNSQQLSTRNKSGTGKVLRASRRIIGSLKVRSLWVFCTHLSSHSGGRNK